MMVQLWKKDPKDAMVNGLAHSGRIIFAAGAVMVAVFFTFAWSGPLPPKEMGSVTLTLAPGTSCHGPVASAETVPRRTWHSRGESAKTEGGWRSGVSPDATRLSPFFETGGVLPC